jgi:predicted branched-subunit amino acid permease
MVATLAPGPTRARPHESSAPPTPPAIERRRQLLAGAGAMAPWLLGIVPFGLVIGVSAARADIPTLAGWLTGPLVFAGSAQVATIQLLDSGAAAPVALAAALAVNVRLVLYSATMAGHWQGTPRWWRAMAAALLIDPTLSVGVAGYERAATPRQGHLHYMGGAVTLLAAWVAAITVGATLGTALPDALHLEFVIPLFLVGELVPRLTGRATNRAVGVAVALGVVGTWAPLHLGALLAIGGGLVAALVTDGAGDTDGAPAAHGALATEEGR